MDKMYRRERGQGGEALAKLFAARDAADEKIMNEVMAERSWQNEVAGKYGDLLVTSEGEVEDPSGNYLFRLPDLQPKSFSKWLNDEFIEFCEGE